MDTGDDGDPGDDGDSSEIEDFVEVDDYAQSLKQLNEEWLKIELNHNVSKVASSSFYELGKDCFHRMFQAKELQNVRRKTPTFIHSRRKLYLEKVPPVHMEIGYQSKDTGIVTIFRGDKTPRNRFPPHEYSKVWEVAHVKVRCVRCVLCYEFEKSFVTT